MKRLVISVLAVLVVACVVSRPTPTPAVLRGWARPEVAATTIVRLNTPIVPTVVAGTKELCVGRAAPQLSMTQTSVGRVVALSDTAAEYPDLTLDGHWVQSVYGATRPLRQAGQEILAFPDGPPACRGLQESPRGAARDMVAVADGIEGGVSHLNAQRLNAAGARLVSLASHMQAAMAGLSSLPD